MASDDDVLLELRGLTTHFVTDDAVVRAVNGVDLRVRSGRTLGVVGESGCGKSAMARSILRLVDPPGQVVGGEILLHRRDRPGGPTETVDLAALDPRGARIRRIRGRDVAMVFQEPMASLSLVHRVGNQIGEAVRVHTGARRRQARRRAVDLLGRVGIPAPERIVDAYPFQLSGGMRQRVMIAMALACDPRVLIADEPTTALDVTTQAQILDLLADLRRDTGMGVVLITHDMGVVAETADEVAVMYLGSVVERGPVDAVFHDPKHPYTRALLSSVPRLGRGRPRRGPSGARSPLPVIEGSVPDPADQPSGCVFRTRCPEAMPGRCDVEVPPPVVPAPDREVRCLLYHGPRAVPDPLTGKEAADAD